MKRIFILTVRYGQDTAVAQITDQARRYPMMEPRQVILVKDAQALLNNNGQLRPWRILYWLFPPIRAWYSLSQTKLNPQVINSCFLLL